jgi:hypothetical protein
MVATLGRRIARLEEEHGMGGRISGTLFTFTDQAGRERQRVVVMQTGQTLDLDAFRLTYPDGELCQFQYAGVDPDRL